MGKYIETVIDGNFIKVKSPYNRAFIKKARQIQGEWEKPYWIFPLKNKEYVINALLASYGECGSLSENIPCVDVIIDMDKYPCGCYLKIDTLIVAERPSRDADVILSPKALVMQGGFEKSGGSVKNPCIDALDGTIIKVENVPLIVAERVKDLDGITIINRDENKDKNNREFLLEERERLVKRLEEIDTLLNET
jgi:hypothetical protein